MTTDIGESLEFASKVVQLTLDEDYSYTAIFNGLAIASAALLMDYSREEDRTVKALELTGNVKLFVTQVLAAAEFAFAQHESQRGAEITGG